MTKSLRAVFRRFNHDPRDKAKLNEVRELFHSKGWIWLTMYKPTNSSYRVGLKVKPNPDRYSIEKRREIKTWLKENLEPRSYYVVDSCQIYWQEDLEPFHVAFRHTGDALLFRLRF